MLERHFKTNQPNRKWVTDVTEFKVNDQKLYLSPILDLFNGEVVSYNLSRHPNFKQITDMLEGAFQKLPNKVDNLILHSDQGWQYQMKSYQNLLKAKGITQSMSRKATCLDNAVAENFFGLLKTELFYLEKFDSIDQLEKAIIDYIDYYNNRRIKLKLNGLSPVQYRIQTVGAACNGVQREHNKKLNNGLPILHKVPPKRDYGRYFCIMAEKGGTSHGGLTEKLSLFFHAKKQEVNAYGR